jgi:hypothetical protein
MTIQFWANDPTILFNKNYILELWPTQNMCYERKLNSITRIIFLISILGFIITGSYKMIITGFITIVIIFGLYKMRKQKLTNTIMKEGFSTNTLNNDLLSPPIDSGQINITPENLTSIVKTEFQTGNKRNPFSNVLLTDIMDNPERKAAPPSFNPEIDESITKNIKKAVQLLNPGINNTSKQLYGDLWQNFELDQSNRSFFSTANTRIANDQTAYAQFLYGNMPSGKSSGPDGDLARVQDNYRYTLY